MKDEDIIKEIKQSIRKQSANETRGRFTLDERKRLPNDFIGKIWGTIDWEEVLETGRQASPLAARVAGTNVKKRTSEDERGLMPYEDMVSYFPPTISGTPISIAALCNSSREGLRKVVAELNDTTGYNLDNDDVKNLLESIGREVI